MSWSKIPVALRIAAVATLVLAIASLVVSAFPDLAIAPRYWIGRSGFAYMAKGLAIYGALELAGLVRTRAAVGAKLAAAGWAATIALGFAQTFVAMTGSWKEPIYTTLQWVWWISLIAVGAGLVITAWRRPIIAIAGGVLWLAAERPPVFDNWMWPQLLNHPDARLVVSTAQLVLQAASVLLLAAAAVGDVPDGFVIRDLQRVRWGHTRIANALWLRVIAVSALPLVTLMIMGSQSAASFKALGYAMVVAGLVNAVSFLGVGFGVLDTLRGNQPEIPRFPLYLAAAGALWCAGVTLYQVPELYDSLFGEHSGFLAERTQDEASAFAILLPLVASAAIVLWTIAVGAFAVRRENFGLSGRAHRTGMWFVILWVANLGVMQWLLPEARSDGSVMLLLLLALACGLVAIVNAARLARDTAELANVPQATIPTATVL